MYSKKQKNRHKDSHHVVGLPIADWPSNTLQIGVIDLFTFYNSHVSYNKYVLECGIWNILEFAMILGKGAKGKYILGMGNPIMGIKDVLTFFLVFSFFVEIILK